MTKRKCPWCGGDNLVRIGSNTVHSTRPGDPYWIQVVYWEDRECGYRETTTPDEVYDYAKNQCVEKEREIIRVHKPRPPLPEREMPEYLRRSKIPVAAPPGQLVIGDAG